MAGKQCGGSLDTNLLLRLILGDVPQQATQVEQLLERDCRYHVADIVLFELVFVLEKVYSFDRSDVIQSVHSIIRHEKINCNRRLFEQALVTYSESAKLSIVDAALPIYATLTAATPLFTFDQTLAKSNEHIQLLT